MGGGGTVSVLLGVGGLPSTAPVESGRVSKGLSFTSAAGAVALCGGTTCQRVVGTASSMGGIGLYMVQAPNGEGMSTSTGARTDVDFRPRVQSGGSAPMGGSGGGGFALLAFAARGGARGDGFPPRGACSRGGGGGIGSCEGCDIGCDGGLLNMLYGRSGGTAGAGGGEHPGGTNMFRCSMFRCST